MNDDRKDRRHADDHRDYEERHERSAAGQDEDRRDANPRERKPSTIERTEWRGSGVCGDRHTD